MQNVLATHKTNKRIKNKKKEEEEGEIEWFGRRKQENELLVFVRHSHHPNRTKLNQLMLIVNAID